MLACAAVCLAVTHASAQQVIEVEEELDFDRPESWAMKYFASVALPSTIRAPERLGPGAILLGFELRRLVADLVTRLGRAAFPEGRRR